MSKNVSFRIELQFESNIEQDEDVMQIAENIARAIKAEAKSNHIAPQDGDTYLEIIRVTPQYINKTIIEHVD